MLLFYIPYIVLLALLLNTSNANPDKVHIKFAMLNIMNILCRVIISSYRKFSANWDLKKKYKQNQGDIRGLNKFYRHIIEHKNVL